MDWLFKFTDPSVDWNFAIVTLMVRFIGVFVVMFVMQVALQVSSRLVRAYEERGAAGPAPVVPEPLAPAPPPASPVAPDSATLVAIGLALALEAHPAPAADLGGGPGPSPWAMAGRLRQLQRTPRP
jgi:hypothetical protein